MFSIHAPVLLLLASGVMTAHNIFPILSGVFNGRFRIQSRYN